MEIQRKTLAELDKALYSFQKSIAKMSDLLEQSIDNASPDDTYFLDYVKAAESIAKTIEKLTIVSPFVAFRNDFEAIQGAKEWLTISTKYIGEKRFEMIQALTEYQEELISRTEAENKQQMILL